MNPILNPFVFFQIPIFSWSLNAHFIIANVCLQLKSHLQYEFSQTLLSLVPPANPLNLCRIQLKRIGDGTFRFRSNLTSLEIPSSVKEIGAYAFSDPGLQMIYFGEGSKPMNISPASFEPCSNSACITNVKVENIDAASNVKIVVFSTNSTLKKIREGAFQRCDLETVSIPSSVERIENNDHRLENK